MFQPHDALDLVSREVSLQLRWRKKKGLIRQRVLCGLGQVVDPSHLSLRYEDVPLDEVIVRYREERTQLCGIEVSDSEGRPEKRDDSRVRQPMLNYQMVAGSLHSKGAMKLLAGGPMQLVGESAHRQAPHVWRRLSRRDANEVVVNGTHENAPPGDKLAVCGGLAQRTSH